MITPDALIVDFSAVINSQTNITTAKSFQSEIFSGEINNVVQNLAVGCSHIHIVFDDSLKRINKRNPSLWTIFSIFHNAINT